MAESIVKLGDCMYFMRETPDKYYDLAIVDPEYGIDVTSMNMGGRKTVKPDKSKTWDKEPAGEDYFRELFRVSKEQIILGGNYFGLPTNKFFIIWDKGETMYGRDFAECEYAWGSYDKPALIYKKSPVQLDRFHPTQKPISLYKWTLMQLGISSIGTKILDTHLGSGSSRIAAWEMGFDFTGYEIDKDYFEAQEKRFKQHISQQRLFV